MKRGIALFLLLALLLVFGGCGKNAGLDKTCTISISCETILTNMDACTPEKRELVPEDGWILKPVLNQPQTQPLGRQHQNQLRSRQSSRQSCQHHPFRRFLLPRQKTSR